MFDNFDISVKVLLHKVNRAEFIPVYQIYTPRDRYLFGYDRKIYRSNITFYFKAHSVVI